MTTSPVMKFNQKRQITVPWKLKNRLQMLEVLQHYKQCKTRIYIFQIYLLEIVNLSEGKMTIAFLLLKLSFTVRKANYASSKGKFDFKIEKIFQKICYFEEFQNAKKRCSIILRYPLELL